MSEQDKTTDDRQICDYPVCSRRGSGHPLACGCRSGIAPRQAVARGEREATPVPNRGVDAELLERSETLVREVLHIFGQPDDAANTSLVRHLAETIAARMQAVRR